ncbi:MAG: EAL domain-containing protein [Gammaproteobacteria bacterium]|nr:EAL domain-containing protein [Gammaproteobacteria bacterium]
MLKKLSLQNLLLISFTLTAIIPLIIFSSYEEYLFEKIFKQQTLNELEKIADKKTQEIDLYFDSKLFALEIIAKSQYTKDSFLLLSKAYKKSGIHSDVYQKLDQHHLQVYQDFYQQGFEDLKFISMDKKIFFTLKKQTDFNANLTSENYNELSINKVVDNTFNFITPFTTTFEYYPPSQKQAAFISYPLIQDGVLHGAIVVQLGIDKFADILSSDTGFSRTGKTLSIIQKHGKFYFNAPKTVEKTANHQHTNEFIESPSQAMKNALTGNRGSGVHLDYQQNKVIATWRYLPILKWGIVVKKDLSEAKEPVTEIQTTLFFTFLGLLIFIVVASNFLGRQLVFPLKILEQNISNMMMKKDIDPVKLKGYDETRKLAISFNKMTAQIAEYQLNLEDNIRQRTHELQRASQVIASTKQAIIITDLTPRIIEVNQAYIDLFGYSEQELLGQDPKIVSSKRASNEYYQEMWDALTNEGHWSGEIWNRKKNGDYIPIMMTITTIHDNHNQSINYVAILTDIEVLKSHEEQLHKLAYYDTLTELPNRMLMQDRLFQEITMAKRNKTKLAVMFMDLDRFKAVNDSLGHSAGDELLKVVAQRLKNNIRKNDTVSRQGGDEFVIILDRINKTSDAAHIAQKIINAIARPIKLKQHNVFVGASIGISFYPDDAKNLEDSLKHADIAMYKAKENGKGIYHFYSDTLDKNSLALLKIEDELRTAIKQNQLLLFYQPQISMDTGQLCGLEALIRWVHPEKGLIPPNTFIPVAEATGIIEQIDQWVLKAACKQLAIWQNKDLTMVKTAVNLSGRRFENPELINDLILLLDEYQISGELIELEITERMLVKEPDKALNIMKDITKLGISLSIDDFGTGYSSLSYLKRFPITTLKVDKSFIDGIPNDPQDIAITHAILSLAKSLGIKVLAEGVESEQQAIHLTEQKCDEIQGYYFSKPLTVEEVEQEWLVPNLVKI